MKYKIYFIIIVLIAVAALNTGLWAQTGISDMPTQININTSRIVPYQASGCTFNFHPRAKYSLKARVKAKKYYNPGSGWQSMIAPYDLCLTWGNLAHIFSDKIKYIQSKRWCSFRYKAGFQYDTDYIYLHYANTHIISTSENIKKAMESINKDQLVEFEGFLVDVKGSCSNGKTYWWNTSLSRKDRGDGACEVFLVTKAVINGRTYQ